MERLINPPLQNRILDKDKVETWDSGDVVTQKKNKNNTVCHVLTTDEDKVMVNIKLKKLFSLDFAKGGWMWLGCVSWVDLIQSGTWRWIIRSKILLYFWERRINPDRVEFGYFFLYIECIYLPRFYLPPVQPFRWQKGVFYNGGKCFRHSSPLFFDWFWTHHNFDKLFFPRSHSKVIVNIFGYI